MEINDFVDSSSPVKMDQEIANNFVQCDIITECLPGEHPDCTSSYTNKLLEYSLLREQTTQMINGKVLEEVVRPESNTALRTSSSVNSEENEH